MSKRAEADRAGKPHGDASQDALADFFAPGIIPNDVEQFFPLHNAKPLIGAMIALFRGGEEEVLVRLVILREIGLRADAPDWSPRELETYFAFFAPAKLNTVLGRLREHELLLWDPECRVYRLSTAGRMVLAALSNLLSFSAEADSELGFYAAQVAIDQLLDLAPAPAYIACDPDPAGIAIALKAAEPWLVRDIAWHPWRMTATDLASLRVRKPLTEVEKTQLAALRQTNVLPEVLSKLSEWMLDHGEKGEQEGYL